MDEERVLENSFRTLKKEMIHCVGFRLASYYLEMLSENIRVTDDARWKKKKNFSLPLSLRKRCVTIVSVYSPNMAMRQTF